MFILEENEYTTTLNWATIVKDAKTWILWIKCWDCNMTSWNPNDIEEWFCANCNNFHDPDQIKLWEWVTIQDMENVIANTASYLVDDLE